MKPNYYIIPTATIFAAIVGGYFVGYGNQWYEHLSLPIWAPSWWMLSIVWAIIYTSSTLAALMMWNVMLRDTRFYFGFILLSFNAALNILWPVSFYWLKEPLIAASMAGFLLLTVLGLVIVLWGKLRTAALLFLPYLLWVSFATYLLYIIITNGA